MKKRRELTIVVIAAVVIAAIASTAYVQSATADSPDGPVESGTLVVQLTLHDDDGPVEEWVIGYKPATFLQAASAFRMEPLTAHAFQGSLNGEPFLSGQIIFTVTSTGLAEAPKGIASFRGDIVDGPFLSKEQKQEWASKANTQVKTNVHFDKLASGKTKLCPRTGVNSHALAAAVEGSATDTAGKKLTSADSANIRVDVTCQTGTFSVKLAAFPFSAYRSNGEVTSLSTMIPHGAT